MDFVTAISALVTGAGAFWLIALIASFIASTAEASNAAPKGETKLGLLGAIAGILSLLTPFMLFVHAYWSVTLKRHPEMADNVLLMLTVIAADNIILTGILALLVALIVLPLLPGMIIKRSVPAFGTTLYKASPVLHVVAFVIAAFACYQSVLTVLSALITGRPPAA